MNSAEQNKIKEEVNILAGMGKSKTEIYNLMKDNINKKQLVWFSGVVANILPDEIKREYRLHTIFLIIAFSASFLIWTIIPLKQGDAASFVAYGGALLVILESGMNIYRYESSYFSGAVYFGSISIVFIFIKSLVTGDPGFALWAILAGALAIMAHWLRKKLFPEINIWGRVRKDENGNYIFSE